jgi:hypothetical protein
VDPAKHVDYCLVKVITGKYLNSFSSLRLHPPHAANAGGIFYSQPRVKETRLWQTEPFENKTGEAKSQVQNIELIWDNAKATH